MSKRKTCSFVFFLLLALNNSGNTFECPSAWEFFHSFEIEEEGLINVKLPLETVGAARAGLEDVRIYTSGGDEVPYSLSLPDPVTEFELPAQNFEVIMERNKTLVLAEARTLNLIKSLKIKTSSRKFIKAVSVSGSQDKKRWKELVRNRPVFRQINGNSNLNIDFPAGSYKYLKLVIDDTRNEAISVEGIALRYLTEKQDYPDETFEADITGTVIDNSTTRLFVKLPARNINISEIVFDINEKLFSRKVTVSYKRTHCGEIITEWVGARTIYKIAPDNVPTHSNLIVPVGRQIKSNQIYFHIENRDSPPLNVRGIKIRYKPVGLRFLAKKPGVFYILAGNKNVAKARYDIAGLKEYLKTAKFKKAEPGHLKVNSKYINPEPLPELAELGTE
ncbi:MAG: DUF3999 family protein, partial [Elusimicrobia bacterium]|nr:DUF3999 family protein [Elusimicrobiota bacterium]